MPPQETNLEPSAVIKGIYDHTIFLSEESGWTVGVIQIANRKDLVTMVGPFTAMPGEVLSVKGRWVHNKKFGEQFEVTSFEAEAPATLDGLRKYLGSGLIKGIGPVYAERLVQRFGLEVPYIIEQVPRRLAEVPGIGKARRKSIIEAWNAQKEIKNIMVFLQSHGVGTAFAVKIFKLYQSDAVKKVKENPYRLASEVRGIGFKSADKIAAHLGIARDSLIRIEAGLLYTVDELTDREGHVYLPETRLKDEAAKLLEAGPDLLDQGLEGLRARENSPVVFESARGESRIYPTRLFRSECGAADLLKKLMKAPLREPRPVDWPKFFDWYREKHGIEFSLAQKQAIETAYVSKVCIVTGGPGTGKSTLIRALTTLFSTLRRQVVLGAPTGRAAKRITEVTGIEAKTIHRLLEFDPKGYGFKRNRDNPLDGDALIIDETSMLDLALFHSLLKGIPEPAQFLMVGDVDQLPSVGAGNVLRDLIESRTIPVVRLTEIFRQAAESHIISNAHRINQGESPSEENGSDFFFIERNEPEACVRTVVELCRERIPKKFGMDPLRHIQVLLPMNRGVVGTQNLNMELQKALNPRGPFLTRGARKLGVGDRVIQTRNNYDLEVFNGDIGFVESIDEEEKSLCVRFEERPVIYESSDLDELELAYAITIHKSQGSEFPAVVIPLVMAHSILLKRNLLYTAVTRGKKLVVLLGARGAVRMAVQNLRQETRFTGLKDRLSESPSAAQI